MSIDEFAKKTQVNPPNYKPIRFYECFKSTYYIPLLFGFNYFPFPISNSRCIRILLVIYSLLISYGSSVLVLSDVKYVEWSPYMFIVAEYVSTVTLLIFKSSRNREWPYMYIDIIDETLHVCSSYHSQLKKVTLVFIIFIMSTRILYSTALCYSFKLYCGQAPFALFLFGFILIAVDINETPRLIVFHLIKYRMGLLKKRVEELLGNGINSIDGLKEKRKYLTEYHDVYGNLLDTIYLMSNQMNPYFLLSLLFSFPKIMFLVYNIIVLHKRGVPLFHLLVLGTEALQWGLIVCLPGFVFEMTRSEVDKLKLVLLMRHKDCKDEMLRSIIKEFLDYMERRPCQYHLYRFIAVDITLPLGMLHLCTTYLIVMVQFSHLFEDE